MSRRTAIAAMSRREGGLAIKGHGGHGNGQEPPDVPAGYVDGVETPKDPEALVKALERIKGLPSPYGARCIAAQALKDWRG